MIMPTIIKPQQYPQPNSFIGPLSAKTHKNGKLGISVYLHCLAAGRVAERLLKSDITSNQALNWIKQHISLELIPFIVACHDVGKLSPGFQAMLRFDDYNDVSKYGTNKHEVVTYLHMKNILGENISSVLLYHHGRYRNGHFVGTTWKSLEIDQSSGAVENDGWHTLRSDLVKKLAQDFNINLETLKEKSPVKDVTFLKYLGGLICVSDWISSDESCFPPEGYEPNEVIQKVNFSMEKYKFFRTDFSIIPDMSFKEVFAEHTFSRGKFGLPGHSSFSPIEFDPNPIQVAMMKNVNGPGLYILEAPMGIGKTEAAFYPAFDLCRRGIAEGVYQAMPTQITSNRIFERMQKALENWFEKDDLHLVHGCADVFHNPKEDDWFKGNKRALLDEFGTGTVDQILMGVLPLAKYFFLRTYGMYRKVVIFDEVHSYSVYTSGLIKSLIKELIEMDCIVIVLTATLTDKFREELLNAV